MAVVVVALAALLVLVGCAGTQQQRSKVAAAVVAKPAVAAVTQTALPPMLAEWTGPYGGLPPFDKINTAQFEAAFAQASASMLAEV